MVAAPPADGDPKPPSRPPLPRMFRHLADMDGPGGGVLAAQGGTQARYVLRHVDRHSAGRFAQMRLDHGAVALARNPWTATAAPRIIESEDGSHWALRPYIHGVSLAEAVDKAPLDVDATLVIARALLRSLIGAHAEGVIHGAIHPGNVILVGDPVEDAVLVDYATALGDASDALHTLDRARYLAPEASGLLDRPVGEPADLYAIGAVLYACLSGRHAFQGPRLSAVLRAHLDVTPPSLRSLGIAVPAALDRVIARLLRKDPRERYQTAQGALADIDKIAAARAQNDRDPVLVIGAEDRRGSLTDPAFIGRTAELALFRTVHRATTTGEPHLVYVEAESGGGKSTLLQEASEKLRQEGTWLLTGQGLADVAQRPFQVLSGVREALLDAHEKAPASLDAVRETVADAAPVVIEIFPELAPLFGGPATNEAAGAVDHTGPEEFGVERTLDALARLLDGVARAGRPAAFLLDDAQWADALTLRLLQFWWQRDTRPTDTPLLVVVAFRSEEVGPDHPLRRIQPDHDLVLPPFGPSDIHDMIESMAGPVPPEVHETTARLAGGNPFLVGAVLHGLVESGALVNDDGGWTIETEALDAATPSDDVGLFLLKRMDRLPERTQALLAGAAVVGKEFDVSEAAVLADMGPADALDALAEARRRRIVWGSAAEGRYAFVHDKLRESLLVRLGDDERRRLHGVAARHLEAVRQRSAYDLAYHYDAAGRPEDALPYALEAAAEARSRFALAIAEQYYRIALRGIGRSDETARGRILRDLGEVLMLDGRYADAEAPMREALQLAPDRVGRAEVHVRLGELMFKRGDVTASGVVLEEGLRALGRRPVRHPVTTLFAALFEVIVQVLHTLLPRLFIGRRAEPTPAERVEIHILSRLAYTYWFKRGAIATGWAHLREMNLAERFPPGPELAQAYSEHAPVATIVPLYGRGLRYARRSRRIREERGDLWGCAQSTHFEAAVEYAASDYESALRHAEEAARVFQRTGDRWEENTARWHVALCHYRLGNLERAAQIARDVHETGRRMGDHQAFGIGLGIWAKARGGRIPYENVREVRERAVDDLHTGAEVAAAEALVHLAAGRSEDAVRVLDEACRTIRRRGVRNEYVAPTVVWFATAARIAYGDVPAWAPARQRRLRAVHKKAVRRALRWARLYRNNLPHALREQAWRLAFDGHDRAAERTFHRSLAVAEAQGAEYEAAVTRRDQAQHAASRGATSPIALEETELTLHRLEGHGAADTDRSLSLADRFAALIDHGQSIVSALEPDAVQEAAVAAARHVLRGDKAAAFAIEHREGTVSARHLVGDPGFLDPEAFADAIGAARPAYYPSRKGGAPWSCRSLMAIPVATRGETGLLLVVGHTIVDGLYGEDELQLAAFVSRMAGAALENADGFTALQHATERLHIQKSLLESQSEAAIDGILVVDPEGRIISHNRRFAELWDIPDEVLATGRDDEAIRYVLDLLEDPDSFLQRVEELYAHPAQRSLDDLKLKGGRSIQRYSAPIKDEAGNLYGRVWFFRDTTAEVQRQEDLMSAYERLKEVDRLKTEFINMAAHELNTPLTPIQIQLHLLDKSTQGGDERTRRTVAILRRNMTRFGELVSDLLEAARLQSGRFSIEPLGTDLSRHLDDLLEPYVEDGRRRGVTFTYSLPKRIMARTDPNRVAQVVQNLVTNAFKYTPERGQVDVDVQKDGDALRVSVSDTGVGLDEGQMAALFRPFAQVHPSGTSNEKGSGLGLYICQGIAARLGGTIEVASPGRGKGSTFTLRLPLVAPEGAAQSEGLPGLPAGPADAPPERRPTPVGRTTTDK